MPTPMTNTLRPIRRFLPGRFWRLAPVGSRAGRGACRLIRDRRVWREGGRAAGRASDPRGAVGRCHPMMDALILFAASSLAGAGNSIAGGGSLITFPVLVWLGRAPILANATNTVSLWPGSVAALHGFRRELVGLRAWIAWGTLPSLVGGVLGAILLLRTPEAVFAWLVPYLILFATALFAVSGPLNAFTQRHSATGGGVPARPRWAPAMLYQPLVSVSGRLFGVGVRC